MNGVFFPIGGRLASSRNKADWRVLDSPKNRTNEFDLLAVKSKKANKTNSSIRFLGEVSRP